MHKKMKFISAIVIILTLCIASCAQADYNNILVIKVIDGDTLRLVNGELVRLIGIDTPELYESDKLTRDIAATGQSARVIQALGRRSYEFTRQLAEGRNARLEFDAEKQDKYGRTLAYVFILNNEDNEIFLNAEIVKQGYAKLMTIPPNVKYAGLLQKLYQQARENKKGLWE